MLEVTERYADGHVQVFPGVRMRAPPSRGIAFTNNPTAATPYGKLGGAIVRDVPTEPVGRQPNGDPLYVIRTVDVIIPPDGEVVVSDEVADALIIQTCRVCNCPWRFSAARPSKKGRLGRAPVCRDWSHPRHITGGLAPMLTPIPEKPGDVVPELAPDLDPKNEPLPQYDPIDLHERVMRRIAGSAK